MAREEPTHLSDYTRYSRLKSRLDRMTDRIVGDPDNTVLWIGAGLSAKFGGLPTWGSFLSSLVTKLPSGSMRSLVEMAMASGEFQIAAELLERRATAAAVGERLEQTFGPVSPYPVQRDLVLRHFSLRDVITTNYDLLLEKAMPWARAVLPSQGVDALLSPSYKIVKIHGSADRPETCVLSTSAYAKAYTANLRWYLVNTFATSSVVFLGTSMNAAEPFFHSLAKLKETGQGHGEHYAVMAVESDEHARVEGKRLDAVGIKLLPYIPDRSHSFVDELLAHLDSRRGATSAVLAHVRSINGQLDSGRAVDSMVRVWNLLHADIGEKRRRVVGDAVVKVFSAVLEGDGSEARAREVPKLGLSLEKMLSRAIDVSIRTEKSLGGMADSILRLERHQGRLPLLRRSLLQRMRYFDKPIRKRLEARLHGTAR